jgi:hypothetical protein
MKYIVNVAANVEYVYPSWISHASTGFVYRRIIVYDSEITVAGLLPSPLYFLKVECSEREVTLKWMKEKPPP